MAHNKDCSPTANMPSSISSSTYLGIPITGGRMARSSSHESFATDVSLLSLSSFTSEIPSRHRSAYDKDDEPDSDRCDQTLVKCREDMLEKMLETHALSSLMSRLMSTSKPSTGQWRTNQSTTNKPSTGQCVTNSEEELLNECTEPRIKGSLYKSFSTSDVFSLSDALFIHAHSLATADQSFPTSSMITDVGGVQPSMKMKSCVSQTLIPNEYGRISQPRRNHLEYLKRISITAAMDDEWSVLRGEKGPSTAGDDHSQGACTTPETTGPANIAQSKNWKKRTSAAVITSTRPTIGDQWGRSNSEDTVSETLESKAIASSKQMLKKKLTLSKEINSCIRDDLMQKLSKHKLTQQNVSVTKSDLEREKGRPLTRLERNFIIFRWLQSLEEDPL